MGIVFGNACTTNAKLLCCPTISTGKIKFTHSGNFDEKENPFSFYDHYNVKSDCINLKHEAKIYIIFRHKTCLHTVRRIVKVKLCLF